MCRTSQYINDICSECNPQTYDKTLAKFAGQENVVEARNADDSFIEYLYECCGCGERVWVDEYWVNRNAVEIKKEEGETNEEAIKYGINLSIAPTIQFCRRVKRKHEGVP